MSTNENIVQKLMKITSELGAGTADKLASVLVCTQLNKNEIHLKEGEVSNHLYYVDKGLVRQYYYKDGKNLTEHFACEGDFFMNVESYLLREPTSSFIEAIEPTILYGIPYEPLMLLINEYPDLGIMYRRFMELILIDIQRKIEFLRLETARARYDRLLKERPEIIRRAPLAYIASYLQMSPETLSRVRAVPV